MRHIYDYALKHPVRQDRHHRLNMDQQLPYSYTDNFFALPNCRIFVVAGKFLANEPFRK